MVLLCRPKAHQSCLTAISSVSVFFISPLVLLRHFQQQVLQCYCSAFSTDNGEYVKPIYMHACIHICVCVRIIKFLYADPC